MQTDGIVSRSPTELLAPLSSLEEPTHLKGQPWTSTGAQPNLVEDL